MHANYYESKSVFHTWSCEDLTATHKEKGTPVETVPACLTSFYLASAPKSLDGYPLKYT